MDSRRTCGPRHRPGLIESFAGILASVVRGDGQRVRTRITAMHSYRYQGDEKAVGFTHQFKKK